MRGVKFVSEVLYSGYRRAALGYLRGLREASVPVTWTPMVTGKRWGMWLEPFEGPHFPDEEFGDIVNRAIDYDVVIVHLIPEYFPQWLAREPDKTVIGLTVWEFEKLPPHWPELLNQMSALIVPCQWDREAFLAGGVHTPIAVIPHIGTQYKSSADRRVRCGVRSETGSIAPGVDQNFRVRIGRRQLLERVRDPVQSYPSRDQRLHVQPALGDVAQRRRKLCAVVRHRELDVNSLVSPKNGS